MLIQGEFGPETCHGWPGNGYLGSREGSWLVGRVFWKDLRSDSVVQAVSLRSILLSPGVRLAPALHGDRDPQ